MTAPVLPTKSAESAALLRIAAPLMVSYVVDILSMIISKAVIGRLGYFELAASGIAADLSYQFAIVTMGLFSVAGVLVAEALGARRRQDVLVALYQSLWFAAVLGMLLGLVVFKLDVVLRLAGQTPEMIDGARPFQHGFALAIPALVASAVLRTFAAAMMRTKWVMAVTVVGLFMQFPVSYGLVYGAYGLPGLGLFGAGLALALIAWSRLILLALAALMIIRREHLPQPAGEAFDRVWNIMPLLRLGLPVAGIVALESGLFAATSQMSGWLGPVPLAAYQMMMPWVAIPFVISLGLSEAAMVRVSFWGGAESPRAARQAGNLAMALGVGIPLLLIVIPLFAPQVITRTFLDAADPGYAEVSALVKGLLLIAAVFQVFDGLQALASHALRGLKDATMPLVIAGIGYWGVGLTASYLLAFEAGFGAHGLWWGVALGLAFTGTLLAWRFETLAKRRLQPAATGTA